MLTSNPNVSIIIGKYLIIINEKSQTNDKNEVTPKSFIFGKTSENTNSGKLTMPNAATKITNEKLMTGIQLKVSTGYPLDFNNTNDPNTTNPVAEPKLDTANRNCGGISFLGNGKNESISTNNIVPFDLLDQQDWLQQSYQIIESPPQLLSKYLGTYLIQIV